MKMNLFRSVLVVAAFGLAACSSEPAKTSSSEVKTDTTAAAKPAGPPEPVTGKTAFYEMYTPAHQWAADIEPLSLRSGEVTGVKPADGKFGYWTAVFGSPSLHQQRTYTYSVVEQLPDISKGVRAQDTEQWAGPTTNVMTFATSDFSIDSDAAYKTVADKAASWLKDAANAEKPVTMTLGAAQRFPAPVWYVLFGDTKSGYFSYLNATTGNIITK